MQLIKNIHCSQVRSFFKFDTNAIHNSDKGALIKEFDAVQLKTK